MRPLRLQALFLSDIHLGSPHCQVEYLDAFLQRVQCEKLYLVGDIIDLWSLSRRFYWPKSHQHAWARLQGLMQDSQSFYLPGNHDPNLEPLCPWPLPAGRFQSYSHILSNGQRVLLRHGDTIPLPQTAPWLTQLGEVGYHSLMGAHSQLSRLQRQLGLGYWPLATFLKNLGVGRHYIAHFEAAVLQELLADSQHQGYLVGHIHLPKILLTNGKYYFNTGDWVESCTALFEREGRLELWRFAGAAQCLNTLSL